MTSTIYTNEYSAQAEQEAREYLFEEDFVMTINDFSGVFTKRQKELIHDNLRAYLVNFGYLKISRADYGGGFYVYTDEQRAESGSYTQYCYSFDYLNGWLYGAVQAVNKIMKPLSDKEREENSLNYADFE